MREQGHMALDRADLCNHPIDPSSNLLGAFPPGQPSVNTSRPGL